MLEQLDSEIKQHQFSLQVIRTETSGTLVTIELCGQEYQLVISDEFEDLALNNLLLNYYMFRLCLDYYINSENYVQWCADNEFNPNDELVKTSYDQLEKMTIEHPELTSYSLPISNYDYQLNSSDIQALRAYHRR